MKANKSWFKLKRYPHIGLPISPNQRNDIEKFIHNKIKISHYAFLPLIRREHRTFKYKLCPDGKFRKKTKIRHISYASHFDSLIYSYYAQQLSKKYEIFLKNNNLGNNVIAYRSVPKEPKGSKCNIDFAKEAFNFIKEQSVHTSLSVIVTDINSFFDNINHTLLKRAWKFICGEMSLGIDEYNIFKHVTRFSYINNQELFELFKDKMICSKPQSNKYVERKVKNMKYFRNKNVIAFCNKDKISFIRSKGLIRLNQPNVGIPQGLPISAILANIYMYRFDWQLSKYVESLGGFYRRYSDDIMIVCPSCNTHGCINKLNTEIKNVKLIISEDKTKIYQVYKNCKLETCVRNQEKYSSIEYLGFAFDGKSIRIKNKGINHYYLKMRKSIDRKKKYAIYKKDNTLGHLFVNQILKKYTPIGSKCHKIRKRNKKTKKFFYTGKRSYGNYWSYIIKSAAICESKEILHQLKRNKPILKALILKAKQDINSSISKRQWFEYYNYGGRIFTSIQNRK